MCREASSNRSIVAFVGALALMLPFFAVNALQATATLRLQVIVQQLGIYKAEVATSAMIMSFAGAVRGVRNVRLIRETTVIPARNSARFGLRYMIVGAEAGASVELKLVTTLPRIGLLESRSGVKLFRSEYVARGYCRRHCIFWIDDKGAVIPLWMCA